MCEIEHFASGLVHGYSGEKTTFTSDCAVTKALLVTLVEKGTRCDSGTVLAAVILS